MSPSSMSRSDRLRGLNLERVAEHFGYQRDPSDRSRWRGQGSVISLTGTKFYDHLQGRGGGGAIDLAMHVAGCPFLVALDLLEQIAPEPAERLAPGEPSSWQQVYRYLTEQRGLAPRLVDHCHRNRLIESDQRANAVFVTRDADGTPLGAELCGTQPGRPFKGMARGSRKAQGGFWIARQKPGPTLLTESAIDALSAFSIAKLRHIAVIISTAGVAVRLPPWITHRNPETILCGYDTDSIGEAAAQHLMEQHPGIRRLCPAEGHKDWNEQLLATRNRPKGQQPSE